MTQAERIDTLEEQVAKIAAALATGDPTLMAMAFADVVPADQDEAPTE